MQLTIPEGYKRALSDLIQMPRKDRLLLVEAVRAASAFRDTERLAGSVASATSLDEIQVSRIVRLLVSLYLVEEDTPPDEVAGHVCDAAEALGDDNLKPKDGDWDAFKEDLTSLLSSDHSLGMTAKALNVAREHGHVFCAARVLTDIRPVFKRSLDDTPAVVLVHTLKLSYHERDRSPPEDFFVALDARGLRELRGVIDRAIQKEATLNALISSSNMEHLEVESD